MIAAALVLVSLGSAEELATCAALWHGYADFARVSAYLDGEDEARQTAEAFARRAGLPASVADQRPGMYLLVRAAIEGDRMSRDLFERQMQDCDALRDD
ncbi:hypothetical protein ACOXXX_04760 [Thalassococcus sp. BH17M4-6]|uniref:hypothetical protein n=1 Tax=Thalassococcus sp. BH17M4-6 TaxID=3413148 RepID=UPI003BBFBBD6